MKTGILRAPNYMATYIYLLIIRTISSILLLRFSLETLKERGIDECRASMSSQNNPRMFNASIARGIFINANVSE